MGEKDRKAENKEKQIKEEMRRSRKHTLGKLLGERERKREERERERENEDNKKKKNQWTTITNVSTEFLRTALLVNS